MSSARVITLPVKLAVLLLVALIWICAWTIAIRPTWILSVSHALWVLERDDLGFGACAPARAYLVQQQGSLAVMKRVSEEIESTSDVWYRGELLSVLVVAEGDESRAVLLDLLISDNGEVSVLAAETLAVRRDDAGREVIETALDRAEAAKDTVRVLELRESLRWLD